MGSVGCWAPAQPGVKPGPFHKPSAPHTPSLRKGNGNGAPVGCRAKTKCFLASGWAEPRVLGCFVSLGCRVWGQKAHSEMCVCKYIRMGYFGISRSGALNPLMKDGGKLEAFGDAGGVLLQSSALVLCCFSFPFTPCRLWSHSVLCIK